MCVRSHTAWAVQCHVGAADVVTMGIPLPHIHQATDRVVTSSVHSTGRAPPQGCTRAGKCAATVTLKGRSVSVPASQALQYALLCSMSLTFVLAGEFSFLTYVLIGPIQWGSLPPLCRAVP